MALVKHSFTLITDDHGRYDFAAGEQEIPAEVADHWYVKAHIEPAPVAQDEPAQTEQADEAPQPSKRKAK